MKAHTKNASEASELLDQLSKHESRAMAVVEEAIRKRDSDMAAARRQSDAIVEKARQKAAKSRESALAAAREKVEKEKQKVVDEAHKTAAKTRSGKSAAAAKAAPHVFSKVFKKYFD